MNTSLFELFKVGIGPSSSHTVGPMRAALRFIREVDAAGHLPAVSRVTVDLYGSLALTGIGHGTDRAVLLGLMGEAPDSVDPETIDGHIAEVRDSGRLLLAGKHEIGFRMPAGPGSACDLWMHRDQMYPDTSTPSHPNGVRFTAYNANAEVLASGVFFSVGGGFIVSQEELRSQERAGMPVRKVPCPYRSAAELLELARTHGLTIAELVLANECALLGDSALAMLRPKPVCETDASPEGQVRGSILTIWAAMQRCAQHGMANQGILPGGLKVRRRAPGLAKRLHGNAAREPTPDPLAALDWVTMWAMAVNEENAAGCRVVTAPTNGAAGVIPAVALYYVRFASGGLSDAERQEGILRYFLTAAAIGILYKENASISGAEVGCQGEVGVACSMAAAGLVAAQNGSNEQMEHAAEIAMEHNLGMTCDPIGGLVQIPCIERNGIGAVKAIHASRIAMHETEGHKLSLDQVIHTMYQTGMDMQSRYKETSLAGLALNVIEC